MSFCTFWDTFLGFDNFLVYASLYFFITVRWWIIWSQENIRRLRRTFFSNTLSLAKCHLSNNIQINTCIIITSYNNSVQTFSAFFHCMYSNPFLPKFWHVYIVGRPTCIFCTLFSVYYMYLFFLFYMFYTYKVLECLCSCTLRLYFLYICIFPYFIHTKLWRDYAVGHWACIFCKPSSDSFSRKTPTFLAHQSTGNRKKITLIRPFSLDFTISYLHQSLH